MPIFGNPHSFAAEYHLEDDSMGVWMLGRICYWCDGKQLGTLENTVSLRDALFCIEQVEKGAGRRASRRFMSMSAFDAFRLLQGTMFSIPGDNEDFSSWEATANDEQWAWHNIHPMVDELDSSAAYYVHDEQLGRLIYHLDLSNPLEQTFEVQICPEELENVLKELGDSLRDIYRRECENSGLIEP